MQPNPVCVTLPRVTLRDRDTASDWHPRKSQANQVRGDRVFDLARVSVSCIG